jgi:hypothetical protein
MQLSKQEWFFLHLTILQFLRDNDWRDEETKFWESLSAPTAEEAEATSV